MIGISFVSFDNAKANLKISQKDSLKASPQLIPGSTFDSFREATCAAWCREFSNLELTVDDKISKPFGGVKQLNTVLYSSYYRYLHVYCFATM